MNSYGPANIDHDKNGEPYWIIYTRFVTLVFVLLYLGLSVTTSFGWSGGGEEVGRRYYNHQHYSGGRIFSCLQQDV